MLSNGSAMNTTASVVLFRVLTACADSHHDCDTTSPPAADSRLHRRSIEKAWACLCSTAFWSGGGGAVDRRRPLPRYRYDGYHGWTDRMKQIESSYPNQFLGVKAHFRHSRGTETTESKPHSRQHVSSMHGIAPTNDDERRTKLRESRAAHLPSAPKAAARARVPRHATTFSSQLSQRPDIPAIA